MPGLNTELRITTEPIDTQRCKFILSRPVARDGEVRRYAAPEDAEESSVARAVLQVPGICEVIVSAYAVTAVKTTDDPWDTLEPQVRYAISTALAAAVALPDTDRASAMVADDDALYHTVSEIFDRQINPAVAQHGGKVELIDVQEGTVVLGMLGGCQGCGMANVTLRQGIESTLRRSVPGFQGLQDITDHASGTNPYFAAGTK